MNANELANWVEKQGNGGAGNMHSQAATMLRQQQAEIEALKEAALKTIPTLKWSEDLLREANHDKAVSDIQDCIVALRLAIRKAIEK